MRKAKLLKPILIGCACCVPVGLVVGLSVNWEHRQFLSSVGSSGTKPFVEAFGKEYAKVNSKVDVQVESGGTTFAVEQLSKGFTNVGNASSNPYETINPKSGGSYKDKWVNKKTFTLGYEGLVILYKLPAGLSQEAKDAFDIVINKDNIRDLLAVFSCYNELKDGTEWTAIKGSMYNFMSDESKYAIGRLETAEQDLNICQNTQITPFVRSGGNLNANSSIAFCECSNLATLDDCTERQQAAYRGGAYGEDRPHHETEESNSRAWQLFTNKNIPGSMIYLTTGFIVNKNNQQQIKNLGYKIAGYKGDKTGDTTQYFNSEADLPKLCKKNGYNWYRPINCMIDLNTQMSIDFIKFIYECSNYSKIVNEKGAKPLTDAQIESMKATGKGLFDLESSDVKLEVERQTKPEGKPYIYGAEDIWE